MVIEVTSPSTEKADKTEKLDLYLHYPTIQEILFVDSRYRHIQHYHRVGMHRWEDTSYERDDEVIELESIEVSLTVRDIYLKVYLELEEE